MSEAQALALRVAQTMLEREATGPAWGILIEEMREGYSRIAMRMRGRHAQRPWRTGE
jgi:acyl-CoA thioesterase